MSTKLYSLIIGLLLVSNTILSQTWPILQADDPNQYYLISATIGEIHGTHFHEAIDINCDESYANGVEVRPIEDGVVVWPGTYSMLIGHNPIGNSYERFSRYLHLTPNQLTIGTNVYQGVTVLGYVDGTVLGGYTNNHLHFEMGEYVGNNTMIDNDDIILHPLCNNSGWQLTLPAGHNDTYLPEINDIIIEPLNNQTNNVPSGYDVNDPNNNNGAVIYQANYLKAHIANTTGSNFSTGPIYNYPNEKKIVWGNIGFIVNARDVAVNYPPGPGNATIGAGEGLTVEHISYSYIDNSGSEHDKYIADFSGMIHGERNSINQFFHTPYFHPNFEYGNNDFIELKTINANLHIHQQINGIQSNGIWFTKALNTTPHVFNQTPTDIAYVNDVAKYKDGEQTLNFYVSDASDQCEDYDLKVIVDNFPPYVKKVEIYQGDIVNNVVIYSANWTWQTANDLLDFHPNIPQVYPGVISGNEDIDHYVAVWYSEPMSEAFFSIQNMNINNEQPVAGTDDNKIFLIDGSRIIIADEGDYEIVFSGKDLANTELFGFTSEASISGSDIPKKDINGNWAPEYTNYLDNIHGFAIENEECFVDFYAENTNMSVGASTVFYNTSVNCAMNENRKYFWVLDGGSPDEYDCGYGDPCESTPPIQYNIPGVWQARLLLYEGQEWVEVETKLNYITVTDNGSLPIPDFSTDNGLTSIEPESSINFVDQTINNPDTWLWTFEGGFPNVSFEQNPQDIYYPTTGYYDVTLSVTNDAGSQTITKEEFIVVSDYATDLEIDCWPGSVPALGVPLQFNAIVNNGVAPYDYTFNFNNEDTQVENGTLLTWVTKSYTFNTTGEKFITVEVEDAAGKTGFCTDYITIEQTGAEHIVDFSWVPENPLLGQDISFVNQTSGGTVPYNQSFWQWFADPYTGNVPEYPSVPYAELVGYPNAMAPPDQHAMYVELGDYPVKLSVVDGDGWEQSKTKIIHFVPEDECIYFCEDDIGWPALMMYPPEFGSIDDQLFFIAHAECCFYEDCNIQPDYLGYVTNIRWKLFRFNGSGYTEVPNSEQYYYSHPNSPLTCTEEEIWCICKNYEYGTGQGPWWLQNNYVNYSFTQKGNYYVQCEVWNPCWGETFQDPNEYTPENLNPTLAPQLAYYDVTRHYFKVTDCDEQLVFAATITGNNNPDIWGGIIILGGIGNHTIEPGAEITYVGHQEIVLSNNFTAKEGCEFTARIEPCPDYSDNLELIDHNDENKNITQVYNSVIEPLQVSIYPNPTSGEFFVVFSQPVQNFDLEVLNSIGEPIITKKGDNYSRQTININSYPDGVYLVKVKIKDNIYIEKIIKQ
ncbi:MAG: T9SS type A sorting domain-containing protein [Bacteroidales bacterium]|nr:T9SS type A sorting domain-containing protein [Bacteroidales bacterium]